ncbi:MAG: alginate lyase family protein [Deltaproteobacteria bacterium]|nr:alginate lyase family protein [Deltaproteobacteria bacterium]
MNLVRRIRALARLPAAEKAFRARQAAGKLKMRLLRRKDASFSSYAPAANETAAETREIVVPPAVLKKASKALLNRARDSLGHTFDLLGSGRVKVERRFGAAETLVNRANRPEAARIAAMIDAGYKPIDWQLDFKSGHRWSERTWYGDIAFGDEPGVDVKVPWELARMQHLPQMAIAYQATAQGSAESGERRRLPREFRNEVLDFVSANPPRWGVNWVCSMDVAIRAANWTMARDLFVSAGVHFDPAFERVFARSVYEHGLHVLSNLEWRPIFRGNHYLADIAGLVFMAAHLPRTRETDAWLAFGVQELVSEVGYQFNQEGTNFESSTCYHRLAAEMAVFATALVLGLPRERMDALCGYDHRALRTHPRLKPAPIAMYPRAEGGVSPFPPWYFERLEKMAEFVVAISGKSGLVPQIGDNDSGRFFKLSATDEQPEAKSQKPTGNSLQPSAFSLQPSASNDLDHRHVVAAINGLFDREDFAAFAGDAWVDYHVVRSLAGLGGQRAEIRQWSVVSSRWSERGEKSEVGGQRSEVGGRRSGKKYPAFGLYVLRNERFHVVVRCGPVGRGGQGAHAHNDQLSFTLEADGVPVIVDPGTYLYTPDPAARNLFRSTAMHNTVQIEGREQNPWNEGGTELFKLRETAGAVVTRCEENSFAGAHHGFGATHRRELAICAASVSGCDGYDSEVGKTIAFHCAPGVRASTTDRPNILQLTAEGVNLMVSGGPGEWRLGEYGYSGGYGLITAPCARIELRTAETRVAWAVSLVDFTATIR